ncbi:MAG: hypothetical protein WKG07_35325 [Hymenobacter sp.]
MVTVAGHGTATTAHQYAAFDPNAPNGPLYYRLAQVDESGATTFSPVVVLAATTAPRWPQPARDRLTSARTGRHAGAGTRPARPGSSDAGPTPSGEVR